MKTKDFLKMINCFIEKHGMKPTSTYAVVQWKEHEYHSLTMTDVDYDDHSTVHFICNDVNIKAVAWKDEDQIANFWLNISAIDEKNAVHRLVTLDQFLTDGVLSSENIDILISSSSIPKNVIVGINPYKCYLTSCFDGKAALVLYVDYRSKSETLSCPDSAFSLQNVKDHRVLVKVRQLNEFEGDSIR